MTIRSLIMKRNENCQDLKFTSGEKWKDGTLLSTADTLYSIPISRNMTTQSDNANSNPLFVEIFMVFKYEDRLIKNAKDGMFDQV
jgi:hypothetical protein